MTTELEAINEMLGAIGEAPVAAIDLAFAEVQIASSILTTAAREIQMEGWRFNSEWGLELTGTVSGEGYTFAAPSNLLSFAATKTQDQYYLDLTTRAGVFYDRARNTAVLPESVLHIDAVLAFTFEQMPEAARRYAVVVATRRYVSRVVGSPQLERFTEKDEMLALRNLKRTQGVEENLNILHNQSVRRILGRPHYPSLGTVDNRDRS